MKILTVIVPSYNMEAYLPKCLGSVVVAPGLMETLEVLVVNDGSKDRTSAIAHGFAAKWPETFKVIDKENGNYGSCVNRGLAAATGFYVKVLDADDHVESAAFESYLKMLCEEAAKNEGAADLVVTDFEQVDPDGRVLARSNFGLEPASGRIADLAPGTELLLHAVTYRLANVRRIGYRQTEGISYTDMEWVLEPLTTVRRLRYCPLSVTRYLVGRSGQTMEVEIYASRYGQVVEVLRKLVSKHDVLMAQAESDAGAFVHKAILKMISVTYEYGAVGCYRGGWHYRMDFDLDAFDRFLADYPGIYAECADLHVPSRRFPFRHVREWRRKRSSVTLKFALYRVYKRVLGFALAVIR